MTSRFEEAPALIKLAGCLKWRITDLSAFSWSRLKRRTGFCGCYVKKKNLGGINERRARENNYRKQKQTGRENFYLECPELKSFK